jgi:hypothetical protein
MVCCPVEDRCCTAINVTTQSRSFSLSDAQRYIPTGQIIVKECSQSMGVTTLVMSILSTGSAVTVLLVLALARRREHEARNMFLDGIYGWPKCSFSYGPSCAKYSGEIRFALIMSNKMFTIHVFLG